MAGIEERYTQWSSSTAVSLSFFISICCHSEKVLNCSACFCRTDKQRQHFAVNNIIVFWSFSLVHLMIWNTFSSVFPISSFSSSATKGNFTTSFEMEMSQTGFSAHTSKVSLKLTNVSPTRQSSCNIKWFRSYCSVVHRKVHSKCPSA